MFGLIEAGGTKVMVGIATAHDDIRAVHRIPTTTPRETWAAVIEWLQGAAADHGAISAIGVASFGPLDLDVASPTWGSITRTTKAHWDHVDLAGPLMAAFGCPVGFDTDVNAAALAESLWGASVGQALSLYLTVGTGVGGGIVSDGRILKGLSHPEMGHIHLPKHPADANFSGICPFHGACLEGLASGPAIKARWGASLSDLPIDHPGHAIIAHYLAHAVCTFQSILEPGRIIMGGGVMATDGLLDRVRGAAAEIGKGYFVGNPHDVIMPPGLGDQSGLLGALALAQTAL